MVDAIATYSERKPQLSKTMAKSTSSDAFISGSYSIPTFVTKAEQFDPMYNAAIVRKRTGRKPKYFVIDEETSEEYEVDASEA